METISYRDFREKGKQSRSHLELALARQIQLLGLPEPVEEYRFDKREEPRRWRFDFAWPAHKFAVEVEGGTHNGGRHVRGKGYEEDTHKYNEAIMQGWRVMRFTSKSIRSGSAITLIENYFKGHVLDQK